MTRATLSYGKSITDETLAQYCDKYYIIILYRHCDGSRARAVNFYGTAGTRTRRARRSRRPRPVFHGRTVASRLRIRVWWGPQKRYRAAPSVAIRRPAVVCSVSRVRVSRSFLPLACVVFATRVPVPSSPAAVPYGPARRDNRTARVRARTSSETT